MELSFKHMAPNPKPRPNALNPSDNFLKHCELPSHVKRFRVRGLRGLGSRGSGAGFGGLGV